jgi:hypothetical protein
MLAVITTLKISLFKKLIIKWLLDRILQEKTLPKAWMGICSLTKSPNYLIDFVLKKATTMFYLPVRTWPSLTRIGCWRRHRTWYQWVSGSVGAVESQTVAAKKCHIFVGL